MQYKDYGWWKSPPPPSLQETATLECRRRCSENGTFDLLWEEAVEEERLRWECVGLSDRTEVLFTIVGEEALLNQVECIYD